MAGLYKIERDGNGNKIGGKKAIILSICLFVLIFISSVMQTTFLSAFGAIPALTLALVSAIGFLCGDRWGAVWGAVGGLAVDILGNTGISFSPILYMLCGYLCGALMGWFLSRNLPSFIVFAAIVGVLREIYTMICCGLLSESFRPMQIITEILVPEYFAYMLCVIPAYGAVWGIYTLIITRDKRRRSGF